MYMLEQDTRAELRAAADSLEALLETGAPDQREMLALVCQMRCWASERAIPAGLHAQVPTTLQ